MTKLEAFRMRGSGKLPSLPADFVKIRSNHNRDTYLKLRRRTHSSTGRTASVKFVSSHLYVYFLSFAKITLHPTLAVAHITRSVGTILHLRHSHEHGDKYELWSCKEMHPLDSDLLLPHQNRCNENLSRAVYLS